MPPIPFLPDFYINAGIIMNSNIQIQNTLNNPPLQHYLPNLNQSISRLKWEPEPSERETEHTATQTKSPTAKRLANTKQ
jgi:hypothetical protein